MFGSEKALLKRRQKNAFWAFINLVLGNVCFVCFAFAFSFFMTRPQIDLLHLVEIVMVGLSFVVFLIRQYIASFQEIDG